MTLPHELRDKIYTYALFAQTNGNPALNQTFEQLLNDRTIYDRPELSSSISLAFSHPEDTTCNATNLLLVNHQLYTEMTENIKIYRKAV